MVIDASGFPSSHPMFIDLNCAFLSNPFYAVTLIIYSQQRFVKDWPSGCTKEELDLLIFGRSTSTSLFSFSRSRKYGHEKYM